MKIRKPAPTPGTSRSRDIGLSLFDSFPSLIWRSGTDAKCDYFNKTWLEFTGRTMDQERGDGWTEGVHPDDLARCIKGYLKAFRARDPFTLEYRLRRQDGEFRWISDCGNAFNDLDGQFAGYIGSCRDITMRKNAEEQVRFQALLLNQVRNAVIATNLEGRITYWNQFAEALYQWNADEVAGRNIVEVTVPVDRRNEAGKIVAGMKAIGFWQGEFEVCRKDGSRFTAEVFNTLVADENGAPIGVVGLSVDISARKLLEGQLKQSREEMRALTIRARKKREEESKRTSRMLHDELGQALNVLNMDLNAIREMVAGQELAMARSQIDRRINSMSRVLAATVRSVHRMATALRPRMLDDFGLAATLEWWAEQFEAQTGVRCRWKQLVATARPNLPQATEYFRIFQELLTNVSRHARARSVAMRLHLKKGQLVLEVEDDGKGFDEPKVLDGRSLGLLGIRERAALYGGRVEICSAPGKGTKVTVTCPLRASARRTKRKASRPNASKTKNSHR